MTEIITTLTSSPVCIAVGIALVLLMVLSLAMRLLKVAVIVGILFLAYVGYLHYSGKPMPAPIQQAEQTIRKKAKEAGTALKENAEVAGKVVQEAAERMGEELEKKLDDKAHVDDIVTDVKNSDSQPRPNVRTTSPRSPNTP